jgi:hypothetical protein
MFKKSTLENSCGLQRARSPDGSKIRAARQPHDLSSFLLRRRRPRCFPLPSLSPRTQSNHGARIRHAPRPPPGHGAPPPRRLLLVRPRLLDPLRSPQRRRLPCRLPPRLRPSRFVVNTAGALLRAYAIGIRRVSIAEGFRLNPRWNLFSCDL